MDAFVGTQASGDRVMEEFLALKQEADDSRLAIRLFMNPQDALEGPQVTSLWSTDPRHVATIENSLGWLDVAKVMLATPEGHTQPRLDQILAFRETVWNDGMTDMVVFGMGGSGLGVKALHGTFGDEGGLRLHVYDRTHPQLIRDLEAELDFEKTLFVIASKSGSLGTIEVVNGSKYFFYRQLERAIMAKTDMSEEAARKVTERLAQIERDLAGTQLSKEEGLIVGLPPGLFEPRMNWEGYIDPARDTVTVEAYLALRLALDGFDRELAIVNSAVPGSPIARLAASWDAIVEDVSRHFAVVTDEGSLLDYFAQAYGHEEGIFRNDENIGGRYSVLSFFGMTAAGLMGIEIPTVLDEAQEMQRLTRTQDLDVNPGVKLGLLFGALWKVKKDKMTVVVSKGLGPMLGLWHEQLNNESLGKNDKAFIVNANETLSSDLSVYGNDRVFMRIRLAEDQDAEQDRLFEQLRENGFPVIELVLQDRETIGALFYMLEVATVVLGHVMEVDPFDQPGVQLGKDITLEVLEREGIPVEERDPDDVLVEAPRETSDGFHVYLRDELMDLLDLTPERIRDELTLAQLLWAFLGLAQDDEYYAQLVYTDRDDLESSVWSSLREAIRDATGKPVMLGVGPIYQHSNGQMYSDEHRANILMFTNRPDHDPALNIQVPAEDYSFGRLMVAQAEGSKRAYDGYLPDRTQRGPESRRNILRVDVADDAEMEPVLIEFLELADIDATDRAGATLTGAETWISYEDNRPVSLDGRYQVKGGALFHDNEPTGLDGITLIHNLRFGEASSVAVQLIPPGAIDDAGGLAIYDIRNGAPVLVQRCIGGPCSAAATSAGFDRRVSSDGTVLIAGVLDGADQRYAVVVNGSMVAQLPVDTTDVYPINGGQWLEIVNDTMSLHKAFRAESLVNSVPKRPGEQLLFQDGYVILAEDMGPRDLSVTLYNKSNLGLSAVWVLGFEDDQAFYVDPVEQLARPIPGVKRSEIAAVATSPGMGHVIVTTNDGDALVYESEHLRASEPQRLPADTSFAFRMTSPEDRAGATLQGMPRVLPLVPPGSPASLFRLLLVNDGASLEELAEQAGVGDRTLVRALTHLRAFDLIASSTGGEVRAVPSLSAAARAGAQEIQRELDTHGSMTRTGARDVAAPAISEILNGYADAVRSLLEVVPARVIAPETLPGPALFDILAQRVIAEPGGRTGELYVGDAAAAGGTGAIFGHSEDRWGSSTPIRDSDAEINWQLRAAVAQDEMQTLILAVGESARAEGLSGLRARRATLERQLRADLAGITAAELLNGRRLVIGYEPRWAIGTGLAADAVYAESAHRSIRTILLEMYGREVSRNIRIIYGGSVTGENAADYLNRDDIDGLLVGSASTTTARLRPIIEAMVAAGERKQDRTGRTPYLAGNLKTYAVDEQPVAFVELVGPALASGHIQFGMAPQATGLGVWRNAASAPEHRGRLEDPFADLSRNPSIDILAQRVIGEQGGRTGELYAGEAIAGGSTGAIFGHSEDRWGSVTPIRDSDAEINAQLRAAVQRDEFGTLILAIGETEEATTPGGLERRNAALATQIFLALQEISMEDLRSGDRLVVAYEPRWAIGTGRAATPEYAESAHQVIRSALMHLFGEEVTGEVGANFLAQELGEKVRIIYGGSVTGDNAPDFMAQENIDGLLVGGAATATGRFQGIVDAVLAVAQDKIQNTGRKPYLAGNLKTYAVGEAPRAFTEMLTPAIESDLVQLGMAPTSTRLAAWRNAFNVADSAIATLPLSDRAGATLGGAVAPLLPRFVSAVDGVVAAANSGQRADSEFFNPSRAWLEGKFRVFQDLPEEERAAVLREWREIEEENVRLQAEGRTPERSGPEVVYRLPGGGYAFFSQLGVRRRPDLTFYHFDDFTPNRDALSFNEEQQEFFAKVFPYVTRYMQAKFAAGDEIVQTDRQIGDVPERVMHARQLVFGTRYPQLPYMWGHFQTFPLQDRDPSGQPDILEVSVPNWLDDITAWVAAEGSGEDPATWSALVDDIRDRGMTQFIYKAPTKGLSFHLGFDYLGEHKMGPLTIGMFEVKQEGGLAVQAALSTTRVRTLSGELKNTAMVTSGPSLHGKSTMTIMLELAGSDLARLLELEPDPEEGVVPMNDDIIFLRKLAQPVETARGARVPFAIDGTENFYYAVPFGVTVEDDPITFAAIFDTAVPILENVPILLDEGRADLMSNPVRNMRALFDPQVLLNEKGTRPILEAMTGGALSESIHVPMETMDQVFWQAVMRRQDIIPPLVRVNAAQYVRILMYGEGIGQGAAVGEIGAPQVEFMSNQPFIMGLEDDEANRLHEILEANAAGGLTQQYYVFNTGGVGADDNARAAGDRYQKIPREVTLMLTEALLREAVTFEYDPILGLDVAVAIVNARGEEVHDLRAWLPNRIYDAEDYAQRVAAMNRRRYYGNDADDKGSGRILQYTKVTSDIHDLGDIPAPANERELAWLLSAFWHLDRTYATLAEVNEHFRERGAVPDTTLLAQIDAVIQAGVDGGLTLPAGGAELLASLPFRTPEDRAGASLGGEVVLLDTARLQQLAIELTIGAGVTVRLDPVGGPGGTLVALEYTSSGGVTHDQLRIVTGRDAAYADVLKAILEDSPLNYDEGLRATVQSIQDTALRFAQRVSPELLPEDRTDTRIIAAAARLRARSQAVSTPTVAHEASLPVETVIRRSNESPAVMAALRGDDDRSGATLGGGDEFRTVVASASFASDGSVPTKIAVTDDSITWEPVAALATGLSRLVCPSCDWAGVGFAVADHPLDRHVAFLTQADGTTTVNVQADILRGYHANRPVTQAVLGLELARVLQQAADELTHDRPLLPSVGAKDELLLLINYLNPWMFLQLINDDLGTVHRLTDSEDGLRTLEAYVRGLAADQTLLLPTESAELVNFLSMIVRAAINTSPRVMLGMRPDELRNALSASSHWPALDSEAFREDLVEHSDLSRRVVDRILDEDQPAASESDRAGATLSAYEQHSEPVRTMIDLVVEETVKRNQNARSSTEVVTQAISRALVEPGTQMTSRIHSELIANGLSERQARAVTYQATYLSGSLSKVDSPALLRVGDRIRAVLDESVTDGIIVAEYMAQVVLGESGSSLAREYIATYLSGMIDPGSGGYGVRALSKAVEYVEQAIQLRDGGSGGLRRAIGTTPDLPPTGGQPDVNRDVNVNGASGSPTGIVSALVITDRAGATMGGGPYDELSGPVRGIFDLMVAQALEGSAPAEGLEQKVKQGVGRIFQAPGSATVDEVRLDLTGAGVEERSIRVVISQTLDLKSLISDEHGPALFRVAPGVREEIDRMTPGRVTIAELMAQIALEEMTPGLARERISSQLHASTDLQPGEALAAAQMYVDRALELRSPAADDRAGASLANAEQSVWFWDQEDGTLTEEQGRNLLGGKGYGLWVMSKVLGLPVPVFGTMPTHVANEYLAGERSDDDVRGMNATIIARLEAETGETFGDPNRPLLVSARSGARISMPGMMDTILNIGLNDATVDGLARRTNERAAWDSYRRLIQMFGKVVLGVGDADNDYYEQALAALKREKGVTDDTQLTGDDFRELVQLFKEITVLHSGRAFPQDVQEQLHQSTVAVFESWHSERARVYRRRNRISDDWGTAVNIVHMVFGNTGNNSATGVTFTADPNTGEPGMVGDFLPNAQGEDVVAGVRTPLPLGILRMRFPDIYTELQSIAERLSEHFLDMQDIEWTVQDGKLWILQTRSAQRSGQAALRTALLYHSSGGITTEQAVQRVSPADHLEPLLHNQFDPAALQTATLLGSGIAASPGAASGIIALTSQQAVEIHQAQQALQPHERKRIILFRATTNQEDMPGINVASAVVTLTGGATSHAAVVTRGLGIPAVVSIGEENIHIDLAAGTVTINGTVYRAGEDMLSVDGTAGNVYAGEVATIPSEIVRFAQAEDQAGARQASPLYDLFVRFNALVSEVLQAHGGMGSWANADDGPSALLARQLGAEGIGLTRTEHQFQEPTVRLPLARRMLLGAVTGNTALQDAAIAEIKPLQREDFRGILRAMDGLKVTIRLLDPPLHEFLPDPHNPEQAAGVTALARAAGTSDSAMRALLESIEEENPMMGYRGARLLLRYPKIAEMQTEAIIEAAIDEQLEGIEVHPKIMVPLVAYGGEYREMHRIIQETAERVMRERGVRVEYEIGTMIELTRAPLVADEIAAVGGFVTVQFGASYFSFGTNDLTQMVKALSRDDYGRHIAAYLDQGLYDRDPFVVIDREPQALVALTRMLVGPNFDCGVCGEHGGDPLSIERFNGYLNYVSGSPYRMPIERLSAAQAVLTGDNPVKAWIRETAERLRLRVENVRTDALGTPRETTSRIRVVSGSDVRTARQRGAETVEVDLTAMILGNRSLRTPLRRALLAGIAADDDAVFDAALAEFQQQLVLAVQGMLNGETLAGVSFNLLDVSPMALLEFSGQERVPLLHELGLTSAELEGRLKRFRDANPAIGTRGPRVWIGWGAYGAKLYEAQIAAAQQAWHTVPGRGAAQLNVPFMTDESELGPILASVQRAVGAAGGEAMRIGLVLETPSATMNAAEMVETVRREGLEASVVFDLLDLTQTTVGMGAQDNEDYLQFAVGAGYIPSHPFRVLDREGVLVLMLDAVTEARRVQPDIPIAVAGPQLTDAASRTTLARLVDEFIQELDPVQPVDRPGPAQGDGTGSPPASAARVVPVPGAEPARPTPLSPLGGVDTTAIDAEGLAGVTTVVFDFLETLADEGAESLLPGIEEMLQELLDRGLHVAIWINYGREVAEAHQTLAPVLRQVRWMTREDAGAVKPVAEAYEAIFGVLQREFNIASDGEILFIDNTADYLVNAASRGWQTAQAASRRGLRLQDYAELRTVRLNTEAGVRRELAELAESYRTVSIDQENLEGLRTDLSLGFPSAWRVQAQRDEGYVVIRVQSPARTDVFYRVNVMAAQEAVTQITSTPELTSLFETTNPEDRAGATLGGEQNGRVFALPGTRHADNVNRAGVLLEARGSLKSTELAVELPGGVTRQLASNILWALYEQNSDVVARHASATGPEYRWIGPSTTDRAGASLGGGLTPSLFLGLVDQTRQDLRTGLLGEVVVGSNIKEMVGGMRQLYERADARLLPAYGHHVEIVRNIERPDERRGDLAGGMGVMERIIGSVGDWRERPVVMVTDGGFKTRFAYKTLSEGYGGLSWMPGPRFESMREVALTTSMALQQLLPDGFSRYVGWSANDNFMFLGRAAIGETLLGQPERLREKLANATVVKGAAKITLLTEPDLALLRALADAKPIWKAADVRQTLGPRWAAIEERIAREKLTDLGMLAANEAGEMTAFMEKQGDIGRLIRLFYDHGGELYKNPFIEFQDARFFERLLRRLQGVASVDAAIGTLDRLPVSFMQTVYQSRFVSDAEWMGLTPDNVQEQDWRLLKVEVDQLFVEERREGRGQIYVIDFGVGHRWVDVGNLQDWDGFLDSAINDQQVRESLGIPLGTNLDAGSVVIDDGVDARIAEDAYVERTSVTGGGTLVVESGVLLSGVMLHVPAGATLRIPAGAKILESDLRDVELEIEPGALIERVFADGGAVLRARSDERVTVLKIGDEIRQARNLRSVPFRDGTVGDLAMSPGAFIPWQQDHPEYLGQFAQPAVSGLQFIQLQDANLGGRTFSQAQRATDYLWMNDRVRRLRTDLDKRIFPNRVVNLKHAWYVASNDATREAAVAETQRLLARQRDNLAVDGPMDQELLATVFQSLAMLMVEAGPYHLESEPDRDRRLALEPTYQLFQALRDDLLATFEVFFSRPEFGEIRDRGYLQDEVMPQLRDAAHGTNPARFDAFMSFRGPIIGNVYDKLNEMKVRTDDPDVIAFIDRIYAGKYDRFGTSGFRGRKGIDFSPLKAAYAAEAMAYDAQHDQPNTGNTVVLPYDPRADNEDMMKMAALIYLEKGYNVHLFTEPTATGPGVYWSLYDVPRNGDSLAFMNNGTPSHNGDGWMGTRASPDNGAPAGTTITDRIGARMNESNLLGRPIPGLEDLDIDLSTFAGLRAGMPQIDARLAAARTDGRLRDVTPEERQETYAQHVRTLLVETFGEGVIQTMQDYYRTHGFAVEDMYGAAHGEVESLFARILGPEFEQQVVSFREERNEQLLGPGNPSNPEEEHLIRAGTIGLADQLLDTVEPEQRFDVVFAFDTDGDRGGILVLNPSTGQWEYLAPNLYGVALIYHIITRQTAGQVDVVKSGPSTTWMEKMLSHLLDDARYRDRVHLPEQQVNPEFEHPFYDRKIPNPRLATVTTALVTTLTDVGFKYIAPWLIAILAPQLAQQKVIGMEESSGLAYGLVDSDGEVRLIPDKDAISVAMFTAAVIALEGKPFRQIVEDLKDEVGFGATTRRDIVASTWVKQELINRFLSDPPKELPAARGRAGFQLDPSHPDYVNPEFGGTYFDKTVLIFKDPVTGRFVSLKMRASGTEPLDRIYVEVESEGGRNRAEDEEVAERILQAIDDMVVDLIIEEIGNAKNKWQIVDGLSVATIAPARVGEVVDAINARLVAGDLPEPEPIQEIAERFLGKDADGDFTEGTLSMKFLGWGQTPSQAAETLDDLLYRVEDRAGASLGGALLDTEETLSDRDMNEARRRSIATQLKQRQRRSQGQSETFQPVLHLPAEALAYRDQVHRQFPVLDPAVLQTILRRPLQHFNDSETQEIVAFISAEALREGQDLAELISLLTESLTRVTFVLGVPQAVSWDEADALFAELSRRIVAETDGAIYLGQDDFEMIVIGRDAADIATQVRRQVGAPIGLVLADAALVEAFTQLQSRERSAPAADRTLTDSMVSIVFGLSPEGEVRSYAEAFVAGLNVLADEGRLDPALERQLAVTFDPETMRIFANPIPESLQFEDELTSYREAMGDV